MINTRNHCKQWVNTLVGSFEHICNAFCELLNFFDLEFFSRFFYFFGKSRKSWKNSIFPKKLIFLEKNQGRRNFEVRKKLANVFKRIVLTCLPTVYNVPVCLSKDPPTSMKMSTFLSCDDSFGRANRVKYILNFEGP